MSAVEPSVIVSPNASPPLQRSAKNVSNIIFHFFYITSAESLCLQIMLGNRTNKSVLGVYFQTHSCFLLVLLNCNINQTI